MSLIITDLWLSWTELDRVVWLPPVALLAYTYYSSGALRATSCFSNAGGMTGAATCLELLSELELLLVLEELSVSELLFIMRRITAFDGKPM